jgi:hypothetical protein
VVLCVVIILIGFTWRLIRRVITKCLYIMFRLTGLTRLYAHLKTSKQRRRLMLERWQRLAVTDGLDGPRSQPTADLYSPESGVCKREPPLFGWPISLAVGRNRVASYQKLTDASSLSDEFECNNNNNYGAEATGRRVECGQPGYRSSITRSMGLPMAGKWCAGLGTLSGSAGRALLRTSGNFLIRDCRRYRDGAENAKATNGNNILDEGLRREQLHLA